MKNIGIVLVCVAMLLMLTACAAEEPSNADLMITRAATELEEISPETGAHEIQTAPAILVERYTFVSDGVELVPGVEFDAAILHTASSVYQVPSCAIEGTDNVYNYDTFELTAFHDGTQEVIYSILLLDPNISTTEGLSLGDSAARVTELYGDGYTQEGTARVYMGKDTALYVILQGEHVASIEYRMVAG